MPGATDLFETDILDILFTNVAAPNIGTAAGLLATAPAGSLDVSLQTVTITDTATLMTANEAAYTGYARQDVVRSTGEWTVSGTAPTIVDNDNPITYPISTSGPESELDCAISLFANSDAMQIYSVLDATLVVNNGVTPEFAAQALAVSLD